MQVHSAPWKLVGRVAFTPDGTSLLAACNPGGVVRFEPGRTAPAAYFRSRWPGPADLDVHPGGQWAVVASGHGGLVFLGLPHLRPLNPARRPFTQYMAFARANPDGGSVLAYHFDVQSASPYGVSMLRVAADFSTGAVWVRSTRGWMVQAACFAAGGKAVAAEKEGWGANTRCRLVVCDPATGTPVRTAEFRGSQFDHIAASPDGRDVCLRFGARLRVFRLDGSADPVELGAGRLHFTGVAYHPSGKYLAATSNDETVKLYDTQSWGVAKTFTWDIGRLRGVAFAPDGTRAAAGSDTGRIVVWDVDV